MTTWQSATVVASEPEAGSRGRLDDWGGQGFGLDAAGGGSLAVSSGANLSTQQPINQSTR